MLFLHLANLCPQLHLDVPLHLQLLFNLRHPVTLFFQLLLGGMVTILERFELALKWFTSSFDYFAAFNLLCQEHFLALHEPQFVASFERVELRTQIDLFCAYLAVGLHGDLGDEFHALTACLFQLVYAHCLAHKSLV